MNDLISRSALLELAHNHVGGTVDCNDIARFPAVDAEVVRHGRWMPYFEPMECFVDVYLNTEIRDVHMGWICSECGRYEQHGTTEEMPYCHCGAKMDGDVNA